MKIKKKNQNNWYEKFLMNQIKQLIKEIYKINHKNKI